MDDALPPPAAHLLVLAHGLSLTATAAAAAHMPTLAGDAGELARVPLDLGDEEPATTVLRALPAMELRDLGLQVDAASLMLPAVASNDEHARQRWQRSAQTPHLAVLELDGPLQAAMAAGVDSPGHQRACTAALAAITAAQQALARRGRVQLWLAALGQPEPVVQTCDIRRVLDRLPRRTRAAIQTQVWPHRAELTCANHRQFELLRAHFAAHCLTGATMRDLGMGRLLLLAPRGLAFGRASLCARPAHPTADLAIALLPMAPQTAPRIDLRGLAIRCAMAAAALGDRELRLPTPMPQQEPSLATADLLPLLQAHAAVDDELVLEDIDAPGAANVLDAADDARS